MNNYFNQNPSNGWNRLAEDFVSLIKVAVKEAVDASIQDKMYENVVFDQKLNTKQLCERWHISDTTLLAWEKKGVITPIQTGGKKKLYSLKDVREAEMNGYIKNVA